MTDSRHGKIVNDQKRADVFLEAGGLDRTSLPIGFFDSGVGGISVLREAVRILPNEDYYFFGDSANAPYGIKTPEEIRRLVLAHAEHMMRRGIKALVIACNTATSAAIQVLRERYAQIPVIGIEPALKPALRVCPHPSVIVMATPATVAGEKFHVLSRQYDGEAEVYALGCPGLMEFVEQGILSGPALEAHLRGLLENCPIRHPDAIVLGCTHYPFVRGTLQKIVGENVQILDGSVGTVLQLQRRLAQANLLAAGNKKGQVIFEMSLPDKEPLCYKLLSLDG